jgi:hypothetical protein
MTQASESSGYVPFPTELLPEPLRSLVRTGSAATGCDPAHIAVPLLCGLAGAIGTTHRIRLKRRWTEPAGIWGAVVAPSGTQKSPGFDLALSAMRRAQDEALRHYASERAEWEMADALHEVEQARWKRLAASGKGEPGSPPEAPTEPRARRLLISDTTVEAIAPILQTNPRGVLLEREELNGWLASFERYTSGKPGADSAQWLSMHGGRSITVDRKGGNPPTIHVPMALVSITGGIQPGILRRAMGTEHRDSGMVARFLYAMPPRRRKQWLDEDIPAEVEAAVGRVFDRLLAFPMEGTGEAEVRMVDPTPEAKAAIVRFVNEHGEEAWGLSDELAAAWSKLEGYAFRLALVHHMARWAADESDRLPRLTIDASSVEAGVQLARWFAGEARRIHELLGATADEHARMELVGWIERRGGTVSVRDLTHGLRLYRSKPGLASVHLDGLEAEGLGAWQEPEPGPEGGRPARLFRLAAGAPVTKTPAGDLPNGVSVTVTGRRSQREVAP